MEHTRGEAIKQSTVGQFAKGTSSANICDMFFRPITVHCISSWRYLLALLLVWALALQTSAQQLPRFFSWPDHYAGNPSMDALHRTVIRLRATGQDTLARPALAVAIARSWIGKPYARGVTKGVNTTHKPIFNLIELDCYTLVDNALALAAALHDHPVETPTDSDFVAVGASYFRHLENMRYRSGKATDFVSRLHYPLDLIGDNEQRGRWQNLTKSMGLVSSGLSLVDSVKTTLRIISTRLAKVPGSTSAELQQMKRIEDSLSNKPLYFLPGNAIWQVASKLKEGDLIFIVPKAENGVEISHVGMVTRHNAQWHLLHASSEENKVVISKQLLAAYLKRPSVKGFVVVRPL